MKAKELNKRSDKELQKLLNDKKSRVVELKMNIASGNVKNVSEMREVKKDIARVYTILTERRNKAEKDNK
ncbi:MAG: 50S ribosomal protein L29 [Candidatus Spechtbacterales bacterium]|nr:50S ribosomal protein L29 [Candidatus Spechtbacterales bacterium]